MISMAQVYLCHTFLSKQFSSEKIEGKNLIERFIQIPLYKHLRKHSFYNDTRKSMVGVHDTIAAIWD